MAFLFDNPLYIINTLLMNVKLRKEKIKKTISGGREERTITVLIPAHNENYDTIYETLHSVDIQTKKPEKIILLINLNDTRTFLEAQKITNIEFEIRKIRCGSKAEAINIVATDILTSHIFIIDVGDVLNNEKFFNTISNAMEDNADACISQHVPKNGHWFVKEMMKYEFENWTTTLKNIYRNYKVCPLPGTGLLLRTNFIRQNNFPPTLAEDAAIGLSIGKVNFTDAKLLYDIPLDLNIHLKQRARWYAGYMQNWKYAKTLFGKWLCITPIISGLATASLIATPYVMTHVQYGYPWDIIDMFAGINLLVYMTYIVIKFKQPKLYIMTPIWWFLTGISFYISLYYLWTGKWFKSPKTIQ